MDEEDTGLQALIEAHDRVVKEYAARFAAALRSRRAGSGLWGLEARPLTRIDSIAIVARILVEDGHVAAAFRLAGIADGLALVDERPVDQIMVTSIEDELAAIQDAGEVDDDAPVAGQTEGT